MQTFFEENKEAQRIHIDVVKEIKQEHWNSFSVAPRYSRQGCARHKMIGELNPLIPSIYGLLVFYASIPTGKTSR